MTSFFASVDKFAPGTYCSTENTLPKPESRIESARFFLFVNLVGCSSSNCDRCSASVRSGGSHMRLQLGLCDILRLGSLALKGKNAHGQLRCHMQSWQG